MLTIFLTAIGISVPNPSPNTTCVEVLQLLRSEHRLEVAAATAVGDTIVYLLTDKSHKKTVQVGCGLP